MLEHDIKRIILLGLLEAAQPLPSDTLKGIVRARFPGVSFTDGDLNQHVRQLENASLIAGTNDPVSGIVWDLTTKGKIKAQELAK